MGTFDVRCALSGIVLAQQRAFFVLLRASGTGFQPVAFPLAGVYDSYGGIEKIKNDTNAACVLRGMQVLVTRGVVRVAWDRLGERSRRIASVKDLVGIAQQSAASPYDVLTCEGQKLTYALVHERLAVAAAAIPLSEQSAPESLDLGTEPASSIYHGCARSQEFVAALDEFKQLCGWIVEIGGWTEAVGGENHSLDEALDLVETARQRFSKFPSLVAVLDRYAEDVDI